MYIFSNQSFFFNVRVWDRFIFTRERANTEERKGFQKFVTHNPPAVFRYFPEIQRSVCLRFRTSSSRHQGLLFVRLDRSYLLQKLGKRRFCKAEIQPLFLVFFHISLCCLIPNTWCALFQVFDGYCIPLVHLERTLYCSILVISGFEAALVVPWFFPSFLGVFHAKISCVIVWLFTFCFGADLVTIWYVLFVSFIIICSYKSGIWPNEDLFRICVYRVAVFFPTPHSGMCQVGNKTSLDDLTLI